MFAQKDYKTGRREKIEGKGGVQITILFGNFEKPKSRQKKKSYLEPKLFGGKLIWALKTGFFLVANLVKILDTGICIFGIRTASGGVNLPKWTSSRF